MAGKNRQRQSAGIVSLHTTSRCDLHNTAVCVLPCHQVKVKDRKGAMPQQPSVLLGMEEEQKAKWRADTDSVRVTAASIIGEYDTKVAATVEASRAELLTLSLGSYKDAMKRKAEDQAKQLSMPCDASKVDEVWDGVEVQWQTTVSSFVQLDANTVAPYSNELSSYIAERRQYWQSENLKESARVCTDEASKIGRRLLRDSEQWMQDQRFQSVSALNGLVDRLQDDTFCVGPGRADAKVVYQLYKVRREVGDRIRQRTSMAQIAYAVVGLWAVYALVLAKRALLGGHGHAAQFELLGHGEGATGGAVSSSGALSGSQRLVLLLGAGVAAALLYGQSVIPDSATGMWLHGLWLMSATLIAGSVVGVWHLIAGQTGRARKANHEH